MYGESLTSCMPETSDHTIPRTAPNTRHKTIPGRLRLLNPFNRKGNHGWVANSSLKVANSSDLAPELELSTPIQSPFTAGNWLPRACQPQRHWWGHRANHPTCLCISFHHKTELIKLCRALMRRYTWESMWKSKECYPSAKYNNCSSPSLQPDL